MPSPSYSYTFVAATTASAAQVNQNFTDILNGVTDGTKDINVSAITAAGTAAFNGNVDLGSDTTDTITCTGRFDADLDPATAATYTFGDATQTWRALYLDNTTTDGGAVYFNASSTAFIKSDASAADLDISGFTSLDLNGGNLKGTGDITPNTTAAEDIGSTSATYRALYLDNGATDGGSIYFNTATTSNLKSTADGATLDVNGFTTVAIDGALNVGGLTTITVGSGNNLVLSKSSGASFAIWADSTGSSNVASIDNNSGSVRFLNNGGSVLGSVNQSGLWTLGASGGTQTHVVNGNISSTGPITITKSSGSAENSATSSSLAGGNGVSWSTTATINGTPGYGQVGVINNNAGGASDKPIGYVYITDNEGDGSYVYQEDGTLYITSTYTNLGTTSGTVVGTQTSDERLKSNIEPLEYGLEKILSLQPIRYEMKGKAEIGFGAQTTEGVIPEAVFMRQDMGRYGMDYVRIIPVLVNAIKELTARINKLEAVRV